jgi:hypothetical protein
MYKIEKISAHRFIFISNSPEQNDKMKSLQVLISLLCVHFIMCADNHKSSPKPSLNQTIDCENPPLVNIEPEACCKFPKLFSASAENDCKLIHKLSENGTNDIFAESVGFFLSLMF